jgi:CubicO group peptidase (beta-lactamase class C family)
LQYEPGERFEYHPTAGHWVIAEMIEVVDERPFQESVRKRILDPLGLDGFLLGGPDAASAEVAELTPLGAVPTPEEIEQVLGVSDLDLGEVTPDALVHFNDPEVRAVGIPGGGGIATAATIAAYYQALLHNSGGLWDPTVLADGTSRVRCDLPDPLKGIPSNRTLGLILAGDDGHSALRGMGHTVSPQTFGHNGAGGQIAWADPKSGLSFAFCNSAIERNFIYEARRTAAIASRAAVLAS